MLAQRLWKTAFCLICTPLLYPIAATAVSVHEVDIPDHITQPDTRQTLVLNGAGIRSKFFVSVYIGALYLPQTTHDVAAILQSQAPRRVMLYCLYSEVSKAKLADAWQEGFSNNNDEQALARLRERLTEFTRLFPALHKGDIVYLDYVPDQGTLLRFNDNLLGTIPGSDFYDALLKVWLGDEPADSSLKAAMLGTP